jgi:putative hydrolase of the HAD superfamily
LVVQQRAGDAATGGDYAQLAMSEQRVLIIDGDDTLWENNVHFEQAIEDFIDFLAHSRLSREQVRAALDEIERLNSRVHGYGSAAFARNLRETYERLVERDLRPDDLDHVLHLGRRILDVELELLPGVADTLAYLKARHRLLLFTKGELEEQRLKVQRSGLADHFDRVMVTKEKDVEGYRNLIRAYGIDVRQAWMIGNSPRSDVNPALEAGLRAVYIPHPHTWRLEQEEIPADDDRVLVLQSFGQLRDHF